MYSSKLVRNRQFQPHLVTTLPLFQHLKLATLKPIHEQITCLTILEANRQRTESTANQTYKIILCKLSWHIQKGKTTNFKDQILISGKNYTFKKDWLDLDHCIVFSFSVALQASFCKLRLNQICCSQTKGPDFANKQKRLRWPLKASSASIYVKLSVTAGGDNHSRKKLTVIYWFFKLLRISLRFLFNRFSTPNINSPLKGYQENQFWSFQIK